MSYFSFYLLKCFFSYKHLKNPHKIPVLLTVECLLLYLKLTRNIYIFFNSTWIINTVVFSNRCLYITEQECDYRMHECNSCELNLLLLLMFAGLSLMIGVLACVRNKVTNIRNPRIFSDTWNIPVFMLLLLGTTRLCERSMRRIGNFPFGKEGRKMQCKIK